MYRIAVVCLGNICRSPIAEVVTTAVLAESGLDDRVEVTSSGTGTWHVGEPMDERAAAVLSASGYDASRHRARHFDADWHDHDLILVMDHTNLADVLAEVPEDRHDRVRLFRSYDPEVRTSDPDQVPDVPDPYYGGPDGFDHVLAIVERTARRLVDELGLAR
ncbi:MAG TPA: low molecular weight protein-tyrosine-phosphatase [Marmoricola sp.]|nr:low molecular weight protein-tyrosine-phosphatase [Marmoricola sp.]